MSDEHPLHVRVAALEHELRAVRAERRRGPIAAAAAAALGLLVTPFAAGAAGGERGSAEAAGNARGETVQIETRNRSRGETGLIANSDGYALRLSNVNRGDGGGAVFGCRAAARGARHA